MSEGLKFDDGKLDWHAMPLVILEPLVEVFEAGIKKGYGRHNCLHDFEDPDRRFFSAAMRHLMDSQLDPLACDEETGCFHLAQVAFNALLRLHHCRPVAVPTRHIASINIDIQDAYANDEARVANGFEVKK